jgi:mannose-1-phosphate guanylyltransferase
MKAMILAAGKGTRVRPLTDSIPKPMVPIINRPLLEFLVDLLRRHGFDEIMISTSYLANHIENYFGDGSRFGVQIGYSFEGYHQEGLPRAEGLGSAGGLKTIQDFSGFYDDTFVVLCGDAIFDLDLGRALAIHREKGALASVVVKEVSPSEVSRYGVVELDGEGRVLQFQEKPAVPEAVSNLANSGVYFFEPEVLDYVPSGRRFDIVIDLFPLLLARKLPFYGIRVPFCWIDVGHTPDYWQAIQAILAGRLRDADVLGPPLAPGIWGGINIAGDLAASRIEGPVYIGSSTKIEPGATILGPTVIGRNCVVESGARVRACVVGGYTRISRFADLAEKIVSGRFCVDRNGLSVELARTGYGFVVDDARERRSWTEDQKILIEFLQSEVRAAE